MAKLAEGDLMLEFKGIAKGIAFRKAVSKAGNDYWAVLRPMKSGDRRLSQYGVKIPALDTDLPHTLYIKDPTSGTKLEVQTERGTTQPKVVGAKGNPKVQFRGKVMLPNDAERMLTVIVSQTPDGSWNLIAKAIGGGGGVQDFDVDDL